MRHSRRVARQGLQRRNDLENSKSLDCFSVLWGDDVWGMLLEGTNIYGRTEKGGWTLREETSVEELKAYIGLRIRMGIYGVGQARDLWQSELLDEKVVAECYSDVFSRERWEDLTRNLHVVDNDTRPEGPTRDRFWKLRPLVDHLQAKFKAYWDPHQHLSLDEEGIKTKARIEMKQYNKEKPSKWFIKVFALVDSKSFLWAFNLYAGKVDEDQEVRETDRRSRNSIGAADSIADIPDATSIYKHVMRLARQLPPNRPFQHLSQQLVYELASDGGPS